MERFEEGFRLAKYRSFHISLQKFKSKLTKGCDLKNRSLFNISICWAACFYVLFAVVYPYMHLHAHQEDTGRHLTLEYHPPAPCPFDTHEDSDDHDCHHQPHSQSSDAEFCRPSSKSLFNTYPLDQNTFSLHVNVLSENVDNESEPSLSCTLEIHSLPPPPLWLSSHITRGPPFIS